MSKRVYHLIVPALLSVSLIVFTAIVSQSAYGFTPFGQFCFLFHAIPSDIGFLAGNGLIFWTYYPILFVVLTLLFACMGYLANKFPVLLQQIKRKRQP